MAKKIEIPQEGFFFDDSLTPSGKKRHDYYFDGKKLTGVTTILNTIAKPKLYQWYANMAVSDLGWRDPQYNSPEDCMEAATNALDSIKVLDPHQWIDSLSKARIAANKRKDDTADLGTLAHAWIEEYINGQINNYKVLPAAPNVAVMTDKFVKWADANVSKFLASERKVFSKNLWFAGTYDFMYLDKEGRKCIGDLKTANGIYDRIYFAQTAAYQICEEENGVTDIFGRTIVRCGKDGSFETLQSFDFDTDKRIFLAALELYRLNNI